ncbi:MAG: GNAT family N-acetyltransferase [Thaumarchaeota archaeon]|nr:GNAT family N-acetyltransferase [Nitrososphaerota archaeon]
MNTDVRVSIRPYGEGDLWILERTMGDPAQTTYLNGPETAEKIEKRHRKYLALSADSHAGCMFTVLAGSDSAPAGNVGYWESEWKGQKGWEVGWLVIPEFQGRGVATAATKLVIESLARLQGYRFVFAFPSVDNRPSNAVCRKLGFALIGDVISEYPPDSGRSLHVNVWKLALPVSGIENSV